MASRLAADSGSFHDDPSALTQTVKIVPSSLRNALAFETRTSTFCRTSVEGATTRLVLWAGSKALDRSSMGLASCSPFRTSDACRIGCVCVLLMVVVAVVLMTRISRVPWIRIPVKLLHHPKASTRTYPAAAALHRRRGHAVDGCLDLLWS
jgi:hypothetical protein